MKKSWFILGVSVFAFAICFAAWVMNGVLVAFLVNRAIFSWTDIQIGWLLGAPILTGSLIRLPLGMLTDRFGGRIVFTMLLLLSSLGMLYASVATSYTDFILSSLIFGCVGGSFAVGVAYVSLWFQKQKQGTALGIFGLGNLGAALTTLIAPTLLDLFTAHENVEGWRHLPQVYGAALAATGVLYFLLTTTRKNEEKRTILEGLKTLMSPKVHRLGFFYFIVFGGFIALAQWLVVYYVSAYQLSLTMAGFLSSCFTLPSAGMRAVGGILADKLGAKRLLNRAFMASFILAGLLSVPMMDVYTVGKGVISKSNGIVTATSQGAIEVKSDVGGVVSYPLAIRQPQQIGKIQVWPMKEIWQESLVKPGARVAKNQLLAKGSTHIYFQANVWIFSGFVILLGAVMGIGMAAVYKAVPEYFPDQVGVVGGTVGMVGSLGGFVYPILFGYLLQWSGLWSICWFFFVALILFAMQVQKWEKS